MTKRFLPRFARIKRVSRIDKVRGNTRPFLLPDFYDDTGVQMPPSPVFPLAFTPLSRQTDVPIVPFLQVGSVSTILVLVVDMVVAGVPIIVPPVAAVMVVIVGLHGRDRDQQAGSQQECTQVTFHLVVTLLDVHTNLRVTNVSLRGLCKIAHIIRTWILRTAAGS